MTEFIFFAGIIVSLYFIVKSVRVLYLMYAGKWESCEIVSISSRPLLFSSGVYGTKVYRPYVQYEYLRNNEVIKSDRYSFFDLEDANDLADVEGLCDRIPQETKYAYVCGSDEYSVIKLNAPDSKSHAYALFMGGMMVLFIILFIWWLYY